jgi:hypothetical protein
VLERDLELPVVLEVVAEAREQRAILVAELELEEAVLRRLEPRRRAEHVAKRGVFGRRQRGEHRPLVDQLVLNLLHAVQDLDAARQLVVAQALDRGVELVKDQLKPQLRDLVLDDEQELVVLRCFAERLLRAQQILELQIGLVADLTRGIRGGRRGRRRRFVLAGFHGHSWCSQTSASSNYNPVHMIGAQPRPASLPRNLKVGQDTVRLGSKPEEPDVNDA